MICFMSCHTLVIVVFFFCFVDTSIAEPITLTVGAIGVITSLTAGYFLKDPVYCKMNECCSEPWIKFNPQGFKSELESRIYGQPYATSTVEALHRHFSNNSPQKALAISFHGPAGTGKNYFASLLRDHRFVAGRDTQYFHLLSASVHFSNRNLVTEYQDYIKRRVIDAVKLCPRTIFVFDEVEKMPFQLLDALKPFIDYGAYIDGVDYTKATFIFLGNDGAELIMRKLLSLREKRRNRNEIPRAEFDTLLSREAFMTGGFTSSRVVGSHLISRYVPFLPLEVEHVRKCIQDELLRRRSLNRRSDYIVNKVMGHLQFVKMFASYGCKRVADKVGMVLEEEFLDF